MAAGPARVLDVSQWTADEVLNQANPGGEGKKKDLGILKSVPEGDSDFPHGTCMLLGPKLSCLGIPVPLRLNR